MGKDIYCQHVKSKLYMIELDENGVTIRAKRGAKTGELYDLNGKSYLVVDRNQLESMVYSGKDVSNVVTSKVNMMLHLFSGMEDFNQDISSWDVSSVRSMTAMFSGAKSFNQDISHWEVSCVDQMECMFDGADSFNCNISTWNPKYVSNMRSMFANTKSFNQPVGEWNLSIWTDLSFMFHNSVAFNQDLSNWDVGSCNVISMFEGAISFNQNLRWFQKPSVKQSFNRLFRDAVNFNGDISSWNVVNVSHMDEMFRGAKLFNQDISNWNVENVEKMDRMLNGAESFNQDISDWKIHHKLKLKKPSGFLTGAKKINKDFSPFTLQKKKPIKLVAKQSILSSEDKKDLAKIKKLLKNNDIDKVNTGLELFKTLNKSCFFEEILSGCEIIEITNLYYKPTFGFFNNSEDIVFKNSNLIYNNFFEGNKSNQINLDYVFINLIAFAPENCNIHESLKKKNIHSLILKDRLFVNPSNEEINFEFPINLLSELKTFVVYPNSLFNWHANILNHLTKIEHLIIPKVLSNKLENLNFLKNCSGLKKLYIQRMENFGAAYPLYPGKNVFLSDFSLEGLEFVSILEDLFLEFPTFDVDVSLDCLSKLKKLQKLSLYNAPFDDFNLFNFSLKYLSVNSYRSLAGLEKLTNLETLDLQRGKTISNDAISLEDIDQISSLINLKTLSIDFVNNISNLNSLSNFTKLESLTLKSINKSSEQFKNFNFLKDCNSISELVIKDSKYIECFKGVYFLKKLKKLKYLCPFPYGKIICEDINISKFQDLTELVVDTANEVKINLKDFKILSKLKKLVINGGYCDLEILKFTPNLEELEIQNEYGSIMDSYEGEFQNNKDLSLFSNLIHLKKLKIDTKRTFIESLNGIQNLKKIEKLILNNIKSLNKISEVKHKENLKILQESNIKILEINKCYSMLKNSSINELGINHVFINENKIKS
tara:strand:+ start:1432 stop:4242 length:2811 start_codon:yes stop_codon:yes gene_type:complete